MKGAKWRADCRTGPNPSPRGRPRRLRRVTQPPANDRDAPSSRLLRLSVTSEGAGLGEQALVERMRTLFGGAVEETRDVAGRFEVAAYAEPPVTLPASLGPWRVEPVDPLRLRAWEEEPHGVTVAGRL